MNELLYSFYSAQVALNDSLTKQNMKEKLRELII